MDNNASSKLILAFVTLILGAVLIGVVSSNALGVTATTHVYNESDDLTTCLALSAGGGWEVNESNPNCNITVTNAPTGWKQADCPLTTVSVYNSTGDLLTAATDYNLYASTGIIQMLDTDATENLTSNATFNYYSYCGDDYMNLSWGRSLLNLIGGFFALALLGISIGLFYSVGKDFKFF